MEAGSVYFNKGRFLPTPCYEMFLRAWSEKMSENKELGSELWGEGGRDSRPRQSQQSAFTPNSLIFTIFLTPSPTVTWGTGQGRKFFFRPSILPFACVRDHKLKEN
jgi:hypothetical protein